MSCISFSNPYRNGAYSPEACAIPLNFRSPVFGRSKLARLKGMALDANPAIRVAAAGDPHLPEDFQYLLCGDEDVNVRRWVARNPAVTVRVLRRLAEDLDAGIRAYAVLRLADLADRVSGQASRSSCLTEEKPMKCDQCGKFYKPGTGTRWPVTQADYLFGDPGPFYSCPKCSEED